nr:hypothetical protein [Dechloromonas sp.]
MSESNPDILRRLRRLVDAEIANEQWRARWARRLAFVFGLPVLVFVVIMLSHG